MKADGIPALKAKLAAAESRPPARPLPLHDLARVSSAVAVAVGELASMAPEHVREEQLLSRLGLDELDRIWLALEIEERLGLSGSIAVAGIRSVAGLVRATAAAVAAEQPGAQVVAGRPT